MRPPDKPTPLALYLYLILECLQRQNPNFWVYLILSEVAHIPLSWIVYSQKTFYCSTYYTLSLCSSSSVFVNLLFDSIFQTFRISLYSLSSIPDKQVTLPLSTLTLDHSSHRVYSNKTFILHHYCISTLQFFVVAGTRTE